MEKVYNLIDGKLVETDGERFEVLNPADGTVLAEAGETSLHEVDRALRAAKSAQRDWAQTPAAERAAHLHRLADLVRGQAEEIASVIIAEQSKIPSLARVEVDFTADYIDYMAEWGRRVEGEIIESDRRGEHIFLYRKPLGVVAGILPWNFPFFLIARKAAPALITGNTIVIKPSEETPINCSRFAQLVSESGLPAGVLNVVNGGGQVGAALARSPLTDMVTMTGSVETGRKVLAATENNLAKVSLELGGKAPAIVLADADLDLAAEMIYQSRVINTGQVCNCAERVYVERPVAEGLIQRLADRLAKTTFGNPVTNAGVDMGSLINSAATEKLTELVDDAVARGASVVTGGKASDGAGNHFLPTLLADCDDSMRVMREEAFGPVLPVKIVDSLDEAIACANDSEYGLTSSVYTSSVDKALIAVSRLDFGETYVNRENFEAMQGFHAGTRSSGIGGADGKHGMYEFTRTQLAYVQTRS